MPINDCEFETERLYVASWRAIPPGRWLAQDGPAAMAALLTPETTTALPPGWQGEYSLERATTWLRDRDAESTVMFVVETKMRAVIGVVLLHDEPHPSDGVALHLGYVLGRDAWGRGIATELIAGLVAWAEREPDIHSIAGGVEHGNPASSRVLEKCGFEVASTGDGVDLYERRV